MDLPNKKYSVIYADPPWNYLQKGAAGKKQGYAAQHYKTMTTDDICALPVQQLARGGDAYYSCGQRFLHSRMHFELWMLGDSFTKPLLLFG